MFKAFTEEQLRQINITGELDLLTYSDYFFSIKPKTDDVESVSDFAINFDPYGSWKGMIDDNDLKENIVNTVLNQPEIYDNIKFASSVRIQDSKAVALNYGDTTYLCFEGTAGADGWRFDALSQIIGIKDYNDYDQLQAAIQWYEKNKDKFAGQKIVLTGHSKGGFLSISLATYLKEHYPELDIEVIVYDSPGFSSSFYEEKKEFIEQLNITNICNKFDPISLVGEFRKGSKVYVESSTDNLLEAHALQKIFTFENGKMSLISETPCEQSDITKGLEIYFAYLSQSDPGFYNFLIKTGCAVAVLATGGDDISSSINNLWQVLPDFHFENVPLEKCPEYALKLLGTLLNVLILVLADKIKEIARSVFNNIIVPFISYITDNLTALLQSAGEVLANLVEQIKQFFAQLIAGIMEACRSFVHDAQTFVKATFEFVRDLPENMEKSISVVKENLSHFLQQAQQLIGKAASDFVKRIKTVTTSFVNNLATFFSNLPEEVARTLSNAKEGLFNLLAEIKKIISELISHIGQSIKEGWDGFVQDASSFFESLIHPTLAPREKSVAVLREASDPAIQNVQQFFRDASQTVTQIGATVGDAIDAATNEALSLANLLTTGITQALQGSVEHAEEALASLAKQVEKFFSGLLEGIGSWFEGAFTGISQGASNLITSAHEIHSVYREGVHTGLFESGGITIESIKETLSTLAARLDQAFEQTSHTILAITRASATDFSLALAEFAPMLDRQFATVPSTGVTSSFSPVVYTPAGVTSNITRDYSDAARQHYLSCIPAPEDSHWWDYTNQVTYLNVRDILGPTFEENTYELTRYMDKVDTLCERARITINRVFDDVAAQDAHYAREIQTTTEQLQQVQTKLSAIAQGFGG